MESKESEYLKNLRGEDASILERLNAEIPAMDEQCQVSVLIPAFLEEKHVFDAIRGFAKQFNEEGTAPLNPAKWEIIVLVNTEKDVEKDDTLKEALRAQQTFSGIKIHVLEYEFSPGERTIGAVRKILTDLAVMRHETRAKKDKNFYIQSTDADLIHVDNRLVSNHINMMESYPKLDAIAGITLIDPELLAQIDVLLLKTLAKERTRILLQTLPPETFGSNKPYGRVLAGGNAMFRSSTYAEIGGYNPSLKRSEDLDISVKIESIRSGTIELVSGIIISSARRFVSSLFQGQMLPSYQNFGEANHEREIRKLSHEQIMEGVKECLVLDENNIKIIEFYLNIFIGNFLKNIPDSQKALELFKGIMSKLGFKNGDYVIANGKITINNIQNIKRALEKYKKRDKYGKWIASQKRIEQKLIK
ncbi:hypothetical protein M0P48_02825 [Candidatus Gracilibacteria bacterium]|nr:hypothetical protein [Candidatus Gracilibacteria bacterium]